MATVSETDVVVAGVSKSRSGFKQYVLWEMSSMMQVPDENRLFLDLRDWDHYFCENGRVLRELSQYIIMPLSDAGDCVVQFVAHSMAVGTWLQEATSQFEVQWNLTKTSIMY